MRKTASACLLLYLLASPLEAVEKKPRPISAAEREAAALALLYLEHGAEAWWDRLAEDSPWRRLGRGRAVAEIAVRCGPAEDATWTLQTASKEAAETTAVFVIELPSGVDEILQLELREADGWKIRDIRSLVDPAPLRERGPDFLSKTGSLVPPAISIACLLAAMAVCGVPAWRRRTSPRRPPFGFRGRVAAALVLALGWGALGACRKEGGRAAAPADAPGAAAGEVEELASLAPLRDRLARGDEDAATATGDLPSDGRLADVARLWRAQLLIVRRQLNAAEKILTAASGSELPLATLLTARLALLRSDADAATSAYEEALRHVPEHDGLYLEAGQALALLGEIDNSDHRFTQAGLMGSRHARTFYAMAQFAVYNDQDDPAEDYFAEAWRLEPMERRRLFAQPALAYVAVRPKVLPLLEVSSPAEPVVVPEARRQPLAGVRAANARLLGGRLTVEVAGASVVVPGGAALAPDEVQGEDAGTVARREEEKVLALLADTSGQGAEAKPPVERLSPHQLETAATALGRTHRWEELLSLTNGLGADVELFAPGLAQLRARALLEAERNDEARSLLIRLAQNDVANRRRDPATFYQLAELMAASENYDLAIRLMKRAQQLMPLGGGSARVRQLEMEKKLAESFKTHESTHFDIRYPAATGLQYPKDVALVLEQELERLRKWIPVARDVKIGIDLFPLREFLSSFSQGIMVLGLYDGRVRLPFADLKSLDPFLVKILSHELAHAMIAEYTGDQAPKWLHEGLAEHLQMVQDSVNPIPDLHEKSRVLSFPLIESVLAGFGEAQLVGLAYNEAAWVLHFVEARYGVRGIHRLLDGFRAGKETEEAIERAFGISAADFEQAAWRWCLGDAPPIWPTELRRYDKELNPYVRKTAHVAANETKEEKKLRAAAPRVRMQPTETQSVAPSMKAWHALYSRRVRGVKTALGPVVQAFRSTQGTTQVGEMCRGLNSRLAELLGDKDVFRSPDRGRAGQQLKLAYQRFGRMSQACSEGRFASVRAEMSQAEQLLGDAAKILAPYGLRP